MSSNSNLSLNTNSLTLTNFLLIEKWLLYTISMSGILINVLTMIYLFIITSYRMKSSFFLYHHCLICLVLSILAIPYSLSFSNYSIRCDYLGNIQVTCVTAQLLNMAAMVASEAYRFEDLIHQENPKLNHDHQNHLYFQYQLKQSNKSTISCGCLSFGIIIIWFSSIILHLGITMIGSESKSYYDDESKSCNFIIRDIRGHVLTLMWIIITIFSLIITVRYIHKILNEVSSKRRTNQPLLSLAILGQSHGQSIASKDILMQQIEQRIKLNILLIIIFIIFWFPLFIVTLFNIKFKINQLILRCLLLLAWSNSSISPLSYLFLLSKCSDFCSLFVRKDRSTTYDSLTSYYNRIGDRFHDIGKWDQLNQQEQDQNQNQNKKIPMNRLKRLNEDENEDENEKDHVNCRDNSKLRSVESSHSDESNSKTNSLFVREFSNPNPDDTNSSLSSLTTITNKQHYLSNGLLVTTNKRTNL